MSASWDLASDVVVIRAPSSSSSGSSDEFEVLKDDFEDLEELEIVRLQGRDKEGRKMIRIVGKFFPAQVIDTGRLKRYVLLKFEAVKHDKFAIVYFHTDVQRDQNSPGMGVLRQIYEALPPETRKMLEIVYFVHPGIRSRLVLATLGRMFLSDKLYWKLNYINRIEFLRDHMKDDQIQVPEFVCEHDDELEKNPLIDYGICVDPIQSELKSDGLRVPPTRGFY